MRGSGEQRRTVPWMPPQAAVAALTRASDDVVLLESTDDRGWSHLAVGGTVVERIPEIPLDTDEPARPAAMGWIGYDGSAAFLLTERTLSFDHAERRLVVRGDDEWTARVEAAAVRHSAGSGRAVESEDEGHPAFSIPSRDHGGAEVAWRLDDAAYLERISRCLEAIRRGDSYQLCLTNLATVTGAADPWLVHSRLRRSSPTHRAGYLRIGDRTLVSASPERFVSLGADGRVSSSPIKGTRRRDIDPGRDGELMAELRADEKEQAENLMIVDLVRNDLSRVADTGSVSVDSLFGIESYPQVHQLVSTVSARLRDGLTAVDVVEALFPAGSMTGAPKLRAMELVAEYEGGPRGLYAGAFGMIRADGSAEFAMTIRGAEFDASGTARVGAGGGITALSQPPAELAEMKLKAAPILAALGVPPSSP